jgi:hypothetical protein
MPRNCIPARPDFVTLSKLLQEASRGNEVACLKALRNRPKIGSRSSSALLRWARPAQSLARLMPTRSSKESSPCSRASCSACSKHASPSDLAPHAQQLDQVKLATTSFSPGDSLADRVLQIAERRYRAGLATRLEVDEASTALSDGLAQIEAIGEAIALQTHQLAALTGQGPGAGDSITRPTMKLDGPVRLPDSLPAELVGHRPDIVAERWRVELAAAEIKVAKAQFYPNINLVAFAGAQRAYELAEQGYRGGLVDYLDVLNAQAELLAEQRAEQFLAHAGLMKALGGGYREGVH